MKTQDPKPSGLGFAHLQTCCFEQWSYVIYQKDTWIPPYIQWYKIRKTLTHKQERLLWINKIMIQTSVVNKAEGHIHVCFFFKDVRVACLKLRSKCSLSEKSVFVCLWASPSLSEWPLDGTLHHQEGHWILGASSRSMTRHTSNELGAQPETTRTETQRCMSRLETEKQPL